jgi:hypothetical protein
VINQGSEDSLFCFKEGICGGEAKKVKEEILISYEVK